MKKRVLGIALSLSIAVCFTAAISLFTYAGDFSSDAGTNLSSYSNMMSAQDFSSGSSLGSGLALSSESPLTGGSTLMQDPNLLPENPEFVLLQASHTNSTAIQLRWNKISKATKYVIYGNQCGKPFKKLYTTKGGALKINRIFGEKLTGHRTYKFYVLAYDGKNKLVKSNEVRFISVNTLKDYANVKTIKSTYDQMLMGVGFSQKVGAAYKMYRGKMHLPRSYGRTLRYLSTSPKVASVDSNGVVTANSPGNADIYIIDISGKYCVTSVTVEEVKTEEDPEDDPVPGPSYRPTPTPVDPEDPEEPDDPTPVTDGYTVRFDVQGHGVAPYNQTVEKDTTTTKPANPSATGYTFVAWFKDKECKDEWSFSTDKVTKNTTLYAKWTANQYTVTFNKNGGNTDANPSSIQQTFDSFYKLPNTEPTKTGYSFAGWYTNESSETNALKVTEDSKVVITADRVLYAHWTPNKYTVNFDKNGGDSVGYQSKEVTYDSTFGTLPSAVKKGYTFDGWYTEASGGVKFTDSTKVTITENRTLYAHWTANSYTVTFDKNGGTSDASPKSISQTFNANYSLPDTNPQRTGYAFEGWFTRASGGDEVTTSTKVEITSSQTLYAHWTANEYTVSFDLNEGDSVTSESKTVTYNSTYGILPAAARTGYSFAGWYTDETAGSKVISSTKVSITSAQTLYAHWTANKYTVTFNKNGGSTDANPRTIKETYDSTYTLPATEPTKTGCSFVGWFTQDDGGVEVTTSTKVEITEAQTLYAHWKTGKFNVTFDKNGGETEAVEKVIEQTYNEYYVLPATEPTKTGHTSRAGILRLQAELR